MYGCMDVAYMYGCMDRMDCTDVDECTGCMDAWAVWTVWVISGSTLEFVPAAPCLWPRGRLRRGSVAEGRREMGEEGGGSRGAWIDF